MQYRKKPVVIEAEQFVNTNPINWRLWCGAEDYGNHLIIHTLEGDHRADLGDYIIKGVKGEFYPCKPDIFEMTYEKV